MGADAIGELKAWPKRLKAVTQEKFSYKVRERDVTGDNYTISLSGSQIPKIAVPRAVDWGEILAFVLNENLPGAYPYTAAVYPYRREQEDPTRMFAGEGPPERTNRRFHYVAGDHAARACRRRSIPRRCTARIPIRGRTSTAAPATPACRSRRSTT
jgi:methylmalonyl-CoA mutase